MRTITMVAIMALVCLMMVVFCPSRMSLAGAVCGGLALIIAAVPALVQSRAAAEARRLPFLPLMGLFYIPFFILPPFLTDVTFPGGAPILLYHGAWPVVGYGIEVMGAILAGVASLVLGMAIAARLPRMTLVPRLPVPTPGGLAWTVRGLIVVQFVFLLLPGLGNLPSIGQLSRPIAGLAFGLAVAAVFSGAIGRGEGGVIFAVLFPLRLAMGLSTGSLNNALALLMVVAVVASCCNRRLLVPMIVAVGVGAALYAPMQVFRFHAWSPTASEMPMVQRMQWSLRNIFTEPFLGLLDGPKQTGRPVVSILAWPLMKRLDQATPLAVVIERTGHDVSPWGGRTLTNLVAGLVPRVLWPDKPREVFGNEFGRRYGLIPSEENQMSVNLPWLTEFYANFQWPGLMIGMALVGVFAGLLDLLLNRSDSNDAEIALAGAVLLPLTLAESNISLMISNLPAIAALLWLVLRFALQSGGQHGTGQGDRAQPPRLP